MKTTNKTDVKALIQEILELYPKLSKENQEKFRAMLEEAYRQEMAKRQRKGTEA